MHKWSRVIIGIVLITLILLGNALAPGPKAQADTFTQDVLPLSGYQIYFSEDHREASRFDRSEEGLSRLGGMLQGLGAELYTLEWRAPVPANADLVVIPGPLWNLSAAQIARLWAYLNSGGNLLMLADVSGNVDLPGMASDSGIFQLLWVEAGLLGMNNLVIRENGNTTQDQNNSTAGQNLPALIDNIYFTTTNINTVHPITDGISGELAFFAARSLEIGGTSVPYRVSPLIFSETNFYGEMTLPADFQDEVFEYQYDLTIDTAPGELPLAAAVENIETATRIVIIGDREFATNGMGLQTLSPHSFTYVYPANAQFLLNTITWLLGTNPVDLPSAMPDTATPSGETATTN